MTPARERTLAAAHGLLCDIEQQSDLLRHTVDGWCAWPILRFELSVLLGLVKHPPHSVPALGPRVRLALADAPKMLRIRRARHVIKTLSSGLADCVNGRFVDIWFDDVMTRAGRTFKIETPNSAAFATRSARAAVPRDMWSPVFDLCGSALARWPVAQHTRSVASDIGRVLRDQAGLDLEDAWVLARLRQFVASKQVYRALLRRVNPQYVLVVDQGEYALMAAAREHGACAIELQHGVTDRTNAAYGWTEYAVRFARRMPLPDRLFLHGEYWRQEVDAWGFWGDRLRVVGSPRMDRYRDTRAARCAERPTVLYTTQGLDAHAVAAFLDRAWSSVDPQERPRLVVKLHPLYDSDRVVYQEVLAKRHAEVTIVAGSEDPSTFEVMQHAQLHMSIASASHYDAIGLGVPTVILPFETHDVALPLWRAGHAHLARTPAELADIIGRCRDLTVPGNVSEHYFARGAVKNTLAELGLDGPGPANG